MSSASLHILLIAVTLGLLGCTSQESGPAADANQSDRAGDAEMDEAISDDAAGQDVVQFDGAGIDWEVEREPYCYEAQPSPEGSVTIGLEGTVEDLPRDCVDYWAKFLSIGDQAVGSYTFDPSATDLEPGPGFGRYLHPAGGYGFHVRVGDLAFETHPGAPPLEPESFSFQLEILAPDEGADLYQVSSSYNRVNVPGVMARVISYRLHDDPGALLDSDAIPTVPPDPTQWPEAAWTFQLFAPGCIVPLSISPRSLGEVSPDVEPLCVLPPSPYPSAPDGAITFQFNLQVSVVDDPSNGLGGRVAPGAEAEARVTFDPTSVDTEERADQGVYEHTSAGYGLRLRLAEIGFETSPENVLFDVRVVDGHDGVNDHLVFESALNRATVPDVLVETLLLRLEAPTGTEWASDELPREPPDSWVYDTQHASLEFQGFSNTGYGYRLELAVLGVSAVE